MSTNLFDTLADAADILSGLGKDWALVGGLAVSTYVEPRFTRDIDIAVAVNNDTEAEQFAHSWTASGFVIHSVIEQDITNRLATIRSHRPGAEHEIVIDLLFASSGIEPEVAAEARHLEIAPDITVPVARPGHLFALKLLSADPKTRPQDFIDLNHLAEYLDAEERHAAVQAVRLIEERGFNRGRDLEPLLEERLGE
ncbi:MAG: nucleotidyl transferase AbiEii/AbiGii toxin family protein [Persicimonas sp.]